MPATESRCATSTRTTRRSPCWSISSDAKTVNAPREQGQFCFLADQDPRRANEHCWHDARLRGSDVDAAAATVRSVRSLAG